MFRVIVPLVIARGAAGHHVYLYRDALLPDGLVDGEAERLACEGFVIDVTPVEENSPPESPKPRTRKR